MEIRHPETLGHVSVHEPAPSRRILIGTFIVLLYAFSVQWGGSTMGDSKEWALSEQRRLNREKAKLAREGVSSFESGFLRDEFELKEEEIPSEYLPNAWACLAIFLTLCTHILFHLLCVWSLNFKCMTLYRPGKQIRHGCYLKVFPLDHKGSGSMVKVEECERTLNLIFTFQNRKYRFVQDDEGDGDETMELISPPIDLGLDEYRGAVGIRSQSELDQSLALYGPNIFELPKPSFWELYKKQLISPIAIFQLFCAVLWMVDTYWKYTMFTFFSILGFEASTALQRMKSMSALRGMSNKNFSLYVFRMGIWEEHPIEDLVPRDIISLTGKYDADPSQPAQQTRPMVPCDCILLRGNAVVNEANLTGESVPQMKDALAPGKQGMNDRPLDLLGQDRIHVLFSGTSLIQATPDTRDQLDPLENGEAHPVIAKDIPLPPDRGVVCCVVRTGFASSQGELVRMIEFSQENVGGDYKETAAQLLVLLAFALVAAGYVLKKSLEDPQRSTYKVLLRCTLIITSVVPASLPMQMAFAVHTALMGLMKSGIFCTEPFRVPLAGRVTHCFFDKTGTITSDQMQAVGVVNMDASCPSTPSKTLVSKSENELCSMDEASWAVASVIAGCQSLIEADGRLLGDEVELAAMKGIKWSFSCNSNIASSGMWRVMERRIERQKETLSKVPEGNMSNESDKVERERLQKDISELEKMLAEEKRKAKRTSVQILQRHHFSSVLQRMSTVCKIVTEGKEGLPTGTYCLLKGSPEAVAKLVNNKPSWYESTYSRLAEEGHRVLAFASRRVDGADVRDATQRPREWVESNLKFAGFVSFKCESRRDSALVIRSLREAAHKCIMLTGDAPLTALSVACETGVTCFNPDKALLLTENSSGQLEWVPAILAARTGLPKPFIPADMPTLSEKYDLIVTGSGMERAMEANSAGFLANAHAVCVYARVSPKQKEAVILAVRTGIKSSCCLMCGDGGNDVGALRQAEVGLALLSGFGTANISSDKDKSQGDDKAAEDALADVRKENTARSAELAKKSSEEIARKRRELMSKQQKWVEEELQQRAERGQDTGVMGQMMALKTVMSRLTTEISQEQKAIQKKHGTSSLAAGAAKSIEDMEALEDGLMVQLGDASTAAPFTTRLPSIGAVVDIVRQGRCTLLSAVQQMQIMMLESMISAYTLSAMSVDGTRPSEAQLMASGTLLSVASLAFSFARPLDKMHPTRPLRSVFHPAMFLSIIGQLAIHLGCMVFIASLAKANMTEGELQDIIQFEKDRNKKIDNMDESAFDDWNWFLSVPFKTNLLNTVCWLVETTQQVSVLFVNYKGRPWMKGLLENQPLFLALCSCFGLVVVCAWGFSPWLNNMLNLVVIPAGLRTQVVISITVSLCGTFVWDRLMVFVFAPHIFKCYKDEVMATTLNDFMPLLQTVGLVSSAVILLGSGSPVLWIMCFFGYRKWQGANRAQQAQQVQGGQGQQ